MTARTSTCPSTAEAACTLYSRRAELVASVLGSTATDAALVAAYLQRHLDADARRAETSFKGPQCYSANVREKIIRAIPTRILDEPGCAGAVRRRIRAGGPASFGLRRIPDIEVVRAAVAEARARNQRTPVTETRGFFDGVFGRAISSSSTTT